MKFARLRALIVICAPVIMGFGPCGPIAGTQLSEPEIAERVTDFRFVQDVNRCAIEVFDEKPHSVTVNCWSVGKQLFIGCQDCEGKQWSAALTKNDSARVRIGESIYPVKATRMKDPLAIQRAWDFRLQKYDEGEPSPVPQGYWLYHMGSRGSS